MERDTSRGRDRDIYKNRYTYRELTCIGRYIDISTLTGTKIGIVTGKATATETWAGTLPGAWAGAGIEKGTRTRTRTRTHTGIDVKAGTETVAGAERDTVTGK